MLLKFAAKAQSRELADAALNRAQLYISRLITSAAPRAPQAPTPALAHELVRLTQSPAFRGRVTSSDILAIEHARSQIELRVRMMTGDEIQLKVSVSSTVADVCAQVLAKADNISGGTLFGKIFRTGPGNADKPRSLNLDGRTLPQASTLAHHQIFEGSLLHLRPYK